MVLVISVHHQEGPGVEKAEDVPVILNEAFRLAVTGRPGPVLVDITPGRPRTDMEPLFAMEST